MPEKIAATQSQYLYVIPVFFLADENIFLGFEMNDMKIATILSAFDNRLKDGLV